MRLDTYPTDGGRVINFQPQEFRIKLPAPVEELTAEQRRSVALEMERRAADAMRDALRVAGVLM